MAIQVVIQVVPNNWDRTTSSDLIPRYVLNVVRVDEAVLVIRSRCTYGSAGYN
jgi:hypothetical protein